jgi:rare lipoprotein A
VSIKRVALSTFVALVLLGGCASPRQPGDASLPGAGKPVPGSGGYYLDDGPATDTPSNLSGIPDPVPRWEPVHKGAIKPYVVFGRTYTPNTTVKPFRQRGVASWYGKKFHGKLTSIGERYDMFALSAAHPTLALPSYVRVTSVASGKQVIVRINDRGPFHSGRIIDLSYAAAQRLGLIGKGSGEVEIEAIVPGETSARVARNEETRPPQDKAADVDSDDVEQLTRELERVDVPKPGSPNRGIYIQLAAFGSAENAENLRAQLSRELDWLEQPLRVFTAGSIHRVQAGPFPSRSQADKAAERIHSETGNKPNVVGR